MIKILNTTDKTQHSIRPARICGDFKEIVILNERDLSEDINYIMCGVSCQLIIVPRVITIEEREILNRSISDGLKVYGQILVLK